MTQPPTWCSPLWADLGELTAEELDVVRQKVRAWGNRERAESRPVKNDSYKEPRWRAFMDGMLAEVLNDRKRSQAA